MSSKNIFVDYKYCIGCRACEIACKQENSIPVGIKWINVVKVGPRMVGNDGSFLKASRMASLEGHFPGVSLPATWAPMHHGMSHTA